MKFYSFDDIKKHSDCAAFARDVYGATVKNGRCNAAWRGGDGIENVSIDREKWYDHKEKRGGGIIQLASFKCGGNIQQAQSFLGEYYRLTPKIETGAAPKESHYDDLLREGWHHIERYDYIKNGKLIHFVVRLQHPNRPGKKEFVQGCIENGRERWGLKGITTVLYRADELADSEWIAIVEGEKSANALIAAGIPATTCCGGSKKWHDALNAQLAGKDVVIFPDNDEPGQAHAEQVAASLYKVTKNIKIVSPAPGLKEKQGIDDWLTAGHTADEIIQLIKTARLYAPQTEIIFSAIDSGPTEDMLAEAKRANLVPFRNYIQSEQEKESRGGKKRTEIVNEPRTHQAMLDDMSKRFLGFPRKQGDEYLFDHDRDTGEIIPIRDSDRLLAWIGRRSKQPVGWSRGETMVSPRQFYCSVVATAHRYESISLIPSWPRRPDVYYAHDKLPYACPNLSRLRKLIDCFCPATKYDRCLMAAFIAAPLWYIPGIPRPAWVIDSMDGQGCGKTTLVELVAQLYGHAPICTSKQELAINLQQIVKRCVSHSGRQARIFLVDNVTGNFKSEELSYLITTKDITGMAPYGHGEETRPNDLTFVVTANTATVDADLAHRLMYINISRPDKTLLRASWKTTVLRFIEQNRLEIVADIVSMLDSHKPFDIPPGTRFPEFEQSILQPCCGSQEMLIEVLSYMEKARSESNIEEEQARSIAEVFDFNIAKLGFDHNTPVFIRTDVANSWGRSALKESYDYKGYPVQLIRNLAKIGMLPQIDQHIKRWPTSSKSDRVSGIAWRFSDATEHAHVLSRDADGEITYRKL